MIRHCVAFGLGTLLAATSAWGAAITVREPAFGLPHIYADTDAELARENGRQIARDRLGQLILLARVGRGTLYQAFGALDPSTLDDDLAARQTGYTSAELNDMWAKLPERERDATLEYCKGVNDTIEQVYAGALPEPLEVNLLRTVLGLGDDLFGNKNDLSDQVDPFYRAPGGADPEHPNGGFQFTPELAISIGILEVRNFGFESFDEPSRLAELQALIAKHGTQAGTQIWDDYRFLNDPLAPVTVPDSTTPGFGGPVASVPSLKRIAQTAKRYPRYDWAEIARRREAIDAHRAEFARKWGAWPMLGSYAWFIGGARSASGYPWIGGFPQTGIQTPSIMHFVENRSAEGTANRIQAVGMEFAGAPLVLIGHTDTVAFTTTTALLRIIDAFFEQVVNESTDALRYSDEGTPAPLVQRTETFLGVSPTTRVFWRSHERGGNRGSRAVTDFRGDTEGAVESASATTVTRAGAFDASFAGGHVAIVGGTGAGQMRVIASATADTLTVGAAWTATPDTSSTLVAVKPGNTIIAVALDSPAFREESTTVLGFAQYQRAESILDIRKGVRLIPSTHNFLAADNQPFNGIGTASGAGGNTGYWASGFSRIRQDGTDSRLPLDGTKPNPLLVASGTVGAAIPTPTTLFAAGSPFSGLDLTPSPINFRYQNPSQRGREFVVRIIGGAAAVQSRRITSNTANTLTLDAPWGVLPSPGDVFEVSEIVGMPEAVNPAEGYTANWNNKQARADEADNFGREWRHTFILQRLAAESEWDRARQRALNDDLAGIEGRGKLGRYLLPRVRQAVGAAGADKAVAKVLAALEAHDADPFQGRLFMDPRASATAAGAVSFLNDLINALAAAIYGDEYSGAIGVPTGSRAFSLVQHAIDSAAGGPPGAYAQRYGGDYFGGGWESTVRDTFAELAANGIPADSARNVSRYRHPLAALLPVLEFPPTPQGNRGTYEQIVDVGPVLKGEFIFPLGQSGHITGSLGGATPDPHFTTLHSIWRDWRFVPMLSVAADLAGGGTGDGDGDGVLDGYERWYFGGTSVAGTDDSDSDGLALVGEYQAGSDPTDADTDDDGVRDGDDAAPQDRLVPGFLRVSGRATFAATDGLRLGADILPAIRNLNPALAGMTVRLSDDDTIYEVVLPAGAMRSNRAGTSFTLRDRSGANNGVVLARLRLGREGQPGRLVLRAKNVDLANAELTDHEVSVTLTIGPTTLTATAAFDVRGSSAVISGGL